MEIIKQTQLLQQEKIEEKKNLEAHLNFNYIITDFTRRTQQQKITNNDYSVLQKSFKDEGGVSLVFQDKYGTL